MKKIYLFIIILTIALLIYLFFSKNINNNFPTDDSKIKVAVSFYILAEFTKQVGGDKVEIINIVPFGAEPHDFEPSPRDIANIYSAKLFIFNGAGFDSWAEKISFDLQKKGIEAVKMTDNFDLLQEEENFDPHIWLDPLLAKKEIEIIKETLKRIDYENALYYEEKAKNYLEELSNLDQDYKKGLTDCDFKEIVVSHNAFGYLAKRYGLSVLSIAGLSPEQEPSPRKLAGISKFIKLKNIRYLFFEPLFPSNLAETVSKETGADILVLNPLEGLSEEDLESGKDYLIIMRDNLVNLRKALQCR